MADPGGHGLHQVDLDDPRWLAFVTAQPDATPFHHPRWAAFLAETYGMRAFALASVSAQGAIESGLPVIEVKRPRRRRWVSLPYTDRLAPLLGPGGAGDGLGPALEAARRSAAVGTVELRCGLPGAFAEDAAWLHLLRLDPDPAQVAAGMRSSVGRNIRKAERMGVEITTGETEDDLAGAFYRLHVATRRRQGVPVQPRRFFSLFWRRLAEPGLATVLLGRVEGEPVAGAVFLTWNGTTIYKFGASDPAFGSYRVNNLLMWTAIRKACADGSHTFDFGRTDDGNDGLRAFKRSWGAEELRLTYSTLAPAPPSPRSHRVEAVLGATLRRSPPWMTRVAGELLYRFAA
jgi:CelD/BcsL family acetyltransferase involved in cellulose biosynthesis